MRQVLVLSLSLALTGCDLQPKEWQGWVYPDGSDLTTDVKIGSFATFEECQESALGIVRGFGRAEETANQSAADYECGYKCKPDGGMGELNVCKETRK